MVKLEMLDFEVVVIWMNLRNLEMVVRKVVVKGGFLYVVLVKFVEYIEGRSKYLGNVDGEVCLDVFEVLWRMVVE